jgi:hypothetical protein
MYYTNILQISDKRMWDGLKAIYSKGKWGGFFFPTKVELDFLHAHTLRNELGIGFDYTSKLRI